MSLNKQPNSNITMELDDLIKIYTIVPNFFTKEVLTTVPTKTTIHNDKKLKKTNTFTH